MQIVTADQNSGCSKLKITVPREPDLETSHRAQRIRFVIVLFDAILYEAEFYASHNEVKILYVLFRPKNAAETEFVTVALPKFKARPLNRKVGISYG